MRRSPFTRKSKLLLVGAVAASLLLLSIAVVFAQGPLLRPPRSPQAALGTGFTYQGQLKNGTAAVNAQCDIAFRLYDDPSAGSQVGSGITQTIPITGGLFTTRLNTGGEFGGNAFNGDARWLEIAVSTTCPAGGSFTTMTPRQPLSAVPYALFSSAPWVTSGGNLYYNTGNVAVGTANPLTGLTPGGAPVLQVVANVSKTTIATTRAFAVTTNDASNPFALDIRLVGDGALANRGAYIQTTDFNLADGGNILLQPGGGNVGIGTTPTDKLSVAGIISTSGGVKFPDGTLQTTAATQYQNVKVVAQSGGDYTSIGAALASIADNSATNHYLIWVAPGTYSETITMKPYVDIEGAGELATKVTHSGAGSINTGTVVGASNAELRWLSVENTGGSTYAIAIYNSGASPRLTHVTAGALGGTNSLGVLNQNSSSPAMTSVTASASGGLNSHGVLNQNSSSPAMTSVTASGSGGTSSNYGVLNQSSSSPAMTNVTASGSGGTLSYGVYNSSSSPEMMNVTANASGGSSSYGVYNQNSSAPAMTNVTAFASGGSSNYGAYNFSSSATINHSTISASGGGNNYGIANTASSGSYTVTVNNSRISGSTDSIENSLHFTTQVGASQLSGGAAAANSGTLTCIFSYNASYVALNALCQ